MMLGNGFGFNWKGLYVTSLLDAHAAGASAPTSSPTRSRSRCCSASMRSTSIAAITTPRRRTSRASCGAAYDAALADYDLLLMPTLPLSATSCPIRPAPRMDIISRAFEMLPNTAPFDVTGHPAITLPCGMSEGLPVG